MIKNKIQPKNWRKVKLGEVADIKNGKTNTQDAVPRGAFPFFDRSTQIKRSNKFLFNTTAVILPGEGAEFIPRYYSGKFDLHQRAYAIIPHKEINSHYLYYSVFSSRKIFAQNAVGSTVKSLRMPIIQDIPVMLPPFEEQKKIAGILKSFDDKIELNNKINQNLEQTAQNIFKEWFVKFKFPGYKKVEMIDSELGKIPEGWKVKRLGDVADVQWGDTSITKSAYIKEGYPAYSASGQDGFRKIYDFDRIGVIISAIGANCGQTWLARNKWSVIKNTIRFWSIDKAISTEYLFLITGKKETWPQRGSAQPFITIGDARKRNILIPLSSVMKKFNDFLVTAYSKMDNVQLENQKLASLRDLLLPKLMSGETRV